MDGNKSGLITYLANEGEVSPKPDEGNFASGSERGLIVTSNPRIRWEAQG